MTRILLALGVIAALFTGASADNRTETRLAAIRAKKQAALAAQKQAEQLKQQPQTPATQQKIAEAQKTVQTNVTGIVKDGRSEPESFQTQLAAGQALVSLNAHGEAKPFIDQTIDLGRKAGDPKMESQGHALLAQSYLQQNDFENAAAAARRALRLDRGNKEAMFILHSSEGRTAGGGGSSAGAGGASAGGADAAASAGGAPSGASAVPERAGSGAESAPLSRPRIPAAVLTKSAEQQRAAALLGEAAPKLAMDPSGAAPLIEKALAADPRSAKAYLMRAQIKRAAGDLAGALEDIDHSLALEATPDAHQARAEALVALGRAAEEIKREFLAAGQAEPDFDAFYQAQLARLGRGAAGAPAAKSGGASAPDASWSGPAPLADKVRSHALQLMSLGLGLVVIAGGLLWATKRTTGGA